MKYMYKNEIQRGFFVVKCINDMELKKIILYINEDGVEKYHKTINRMLSTNELDEELKNWFKSRRK